ncbi:MAG TPA: dihydrolipoyl dehydrogenase [Dehalococcoidia bacterium]|nr:dihydrolipoyl dehydrogenase [Dehalococcoidia bacterium]
MAERYDVVVLGGGPGSYTTAIRASQLGLKAALVERDRVGGLCLNWGCIPSKAIIHTATLVDAVRHGEDFGILADNVRFDLGAAVDASRRVVDKMVSGVEFLLERNKVDVLHGEGRFTAADRLVVDGNEVTAKNVIVATGAEMRSIPALAVDGQTVITSREALELRDLPPSIAIVGGGPIGLEFAYVYSAYGAEVTVIEMLPNLLPQEDEEVGKHLERVMKKRGVRVMTDARVESLDRADGLVTLHVANGQREESVRAAKVLVAVGMTGRVEGYGLQEIGVEVDRGFIKVDDLGRTSVPGVWAIGDVAGPPLLAHVAAARGVAAVETIAGRTAYLPPAVDMPRATYCDPEVASVGLTEAQAREQGRDVKIGKFPFSGNGRAIAQDSADGFVKVVVDGQYGEILGLHIIGPAASELLGEASLARALEITAAELGATVHAHPTLAEALKEAALAVNGEAIHFWQAKSARVAAAAR